MLSQRLATAAVGIPLIVAVVWFGGWLITGVVAVAVLIAVVEFAGGRGVARQPMVLLNALAVALLPVAAHEGFDYLLGGVVLAILLPTALLARTRDPREGVEVWLWAIGPALYIGLLASHFVLLRGLPDGREWVFFVLLAVWAADTGAYAVGRSFGARAHKLAPAISPGKTWEGAAGGAVTGFIIVVLLDLILGLELSVADTIALGLIVPQVALVGDLAESAIKRSMGVKDSSGLIPGHGGIADRLDSLLFAAPVVYYYLKWIVL